MTNKSLSKLPVLASSLLCFMSCEGSRPRRVYEAGKSVYANYEETGDPTWLIIFIVLLLVVAAIWLWSKKK